MKKLFGANFFRFYSVILLFVSIFSFAICLHSQTHPRSEIKNHNGTPTMFINNEPNPGLCYMTYNFKPDHFKQFGEIGVNLASFSTTGDHSFYFRIPETWVAPDTYDYTDVDHRFNTILKANPNAQIFPRIYICSPAWWDSLHQEELMVFDGGTTQPSFWPPPKDKRKKSGSFLFVIEMA